MWRPTKKQIKEYLKLFIDATEVLIRLLRVLLLFWD